MQNQKEFFFDNNANLKATDRLKIMLCAIEKIIWNNLEIISPGISNANPNNHKNLKMTQKQAQSLKDSMDPLLRSLEKHKKDSSDSPVVDTENITEAHEQLSELFSQSNQKRLTTTEAIALVKERTGRAYYNRFTMYFIPEPRPKVITVDDSCEETEDIRKSGDFDPSRYNKYTHWTHYYPSRTNANNAHNYKALGTLCLDTLVFFDLGITEFIIHGTKVPIMNDLEFLDHYLTSIRSILNTLLTFKNKIQYTADTCSAEAAQKLTKEFFESTQKLASLTYEFFEITKWKLENYHAYCLLTDKEYTIKDYATRMGMLGYFGGSQLGNQIKKEILDNEFISCSTLVDDIVKLVDIKIETRLIECSTVIQGVFARKQPFYTDIQKLEGTSNHNDNDIADHEKQIGQLNLKIEGTTKNLDEKLSEKEQKEQKLNNAEIKSTEMEHSLNMSTKF